MVKVSVIVPVYNMEAHLEKCLDSILSQTLAEIEIICVDDGSVDRSPEILHRYAGRDERIRIISKPNGGLVSARKAGTEAALGEYIGFVDSDDWIEPEMYARLYALASADGADMVSSDYRQEGAYSSISEDAAVAGVYGPDAIQGLREGAILDLKKHDKGISGSLCTKLFRAALFKKIMPLIPEAVTVSEDKITMLTFLLECSCAVIIHEAYYHYVIHQSSMFHADDPAYLLNCHNIYQYFRTLYAHKNFSENMRKQAELYVVQFLFKGINTQLGFSFRNMMRIDPYWLSDERLGEDIVLYGAGELGEIYKKQLLHRKGKRFICQIDFDHERYQDRGEEVLPPYSILNSSFDSIVITIKNRGAAGRIREKLRDIGIDGDRIFWFEQEEIFWRYADAIGLLEEQ